MTAMETQFGWVLDVFLSFSKGKMSYTSQVAEEQQIMISFGIPPSFQKIDFMRPDCPGKKEPSK